MVYVLHSVSSITSVPSWICLFHVHRSLSLPAVLERPAESTAEPSPPYQTTGPFPDSTEHRAVSDSTLKFLQQTQFPASEFLP